MRELLVDRGADTPAVGKRRRMAVRSPRDKIEKLGERQRPGERDLLGGKTKGKLVAHANGTNGSNGVNGHGKKKEKKGKKGKKKEKHGFAEA